MARLRFGRPISLRWNGLLLEGPANTVFEIPDEFYEEFNEDIGPVEPTLVWLDTDEASTLRGRVTALEGAGSTTLSSDEALALGTASAGVGTESSRDDHVHPTTGLSLSGHNHNGTYEPVNTAILKTIVDAKGDLIVGTEDDTVSRLAVSATDGHVLSADSTSATGLAWVAQTGGGGGHSLGTAIPLDLGTADAGTSTNGSREDHVHSTNGLALDGHDHDASYSSTAHNHSGVYELSGAVSTHESEGDPHPGYLTETDASSTYATSGHDHDGSYSTTAHNHDGSYSTTAHDHDGTYSTTAHDHTGTYEVAGAVSTHNSSVTHLALGTSSVTAAAGDHDHTGVYEVSGTTATHAGLTTSVHGISNTADLVYTSDSRLSDSRTPTSHTHDQTDVTSLTTDLADKISKTIVDAKGDIIVATASDTVSRLEVGATDGHVLTVDSAEATGLKWAAASGGSVGGMTLLASATSTSNLVVTSIPSTYKDLYIRVVQNVSTVPKFSITGLTLNSGTFSSFNQGVLKIDSDATFASVTLEGEDAASSPGTSPASLPLGENHYMETQEAANGGIFEMTFFDYANASNLNNTNRFFKQQSIAPTNSSSPTKAPFIVGGGAYVVSSGTSAITGFTIDNGSGTSMSMYVYGVS